MSKVLRFKGESGLKVTKKKKKSTSKQESSVPLWREVSQLNGLVVIYYKHQIINHVGGTGYLSLKEVKREVDDDGNGNGTTGEDVTADNDNPNDSAQLPLPQVGSQVFKAHSLPGSTKIVLKSCFEKYIGVDKLGLVGCSAEAAGGCEMWEGIKNEDGSWSFKGFFGSYMNVVDGVLRCDSDEINEFSKFRVMQQSEEALAKKEKVSSAGLELETLAKFHSFGKKEIIELSKDTKALAKARKEGNLNQVLLDRRSLVKKDKFC